MRRRAQARGQATVELALGGTLLVTIVLLGLWLSEVSFLSLKVQEASAAAVWDATGRPTFEYQDWRSPGKVREGLEELYPGVSLALTRRYRDFDASKQAGSGTARLFARGTGLSVQCTPANGPVAYNIPAYTTYENGRGAAAPQVNQTLRRWYQPRGGTRCVAQANALPFELPQTFLDKSTSGGFFSDFRQDLPIRLCGAGRAVGGSCTASYGVLLGDWGMDGDNTSRARKKLTRDVVLPLEDQGTPYTRKTPRPHPKSNTAYWEMVRTLFKRGDRGYGADGPPRSAAAYAAFLAGQKALHNENNFYMSFAGVEHDYVDMLEPDDPIPFKCRNCHFNTAGTMPANGNPTPAPEADWNKLRKPCFLGLGGCKVR